MKKLIITIIVITIALSSYFIGKSQNDMLPPPNLKTYYMVFLKKGPNRDQPKEEAAEIQRGHLKNIKKLAKDGKIVLAGPFLDEHEIRGIFIFDAESKEEVDSLCQTDPAVKSGRLEVEIHRWLSEPGNCLPG